VTADLDDLGRALADVGRRVREAITTRPREPADSRVVRTEGGDDVFGIDAVADRVVLGALAALGDRWPGRLVMEGIAEPVTIGKTGGPWTYLVDPIDGSRAWLAGKRSAYVLLGAGRDATTLDDLEVGAAVELPTPRAALGLVTYATNEGGPPHAEDDDLVTQGPPRPTTLVPRQDADIERTFVTVARFAPGSKQVIGAWEDDLLGGLEVYEDPWLCTGGLLIGLATGSDSAVFDPRPLLTAGLGAHPYDLAAIVVARAAGVVVEALPPGPLDVPLDNTTPVAWAGYANAAIAERLRPRRATPAPGRAGSG
jgi:fructose-1,6-bisphosphatase/inositol monophosphatase family enzyme